MPHILADLLFVQSDCVYTISPRPEVISPVRLLLQLPILIQYPYRCPTLYCPHVFRYRYFRRHHYLQVHMICLYVQFQNLSSLTIREAQD